MQYFSNNQEFSLLSDRYHKDTEKNVNPSKPKAVMAIYAEMLLAFWPEVDCAQ
jgi:hypothetical protein